MCLVNGYNAAFIRKRVREGKENRDLQDKEENVLLCFHYIQGTLDKHFILTFEVDKKIRQFFISLILWLGYEEGWL